MILHWGDIDGGVSLVCWKISFVVGESRRKPYPFPARDAAELHLSRFSDAGFEINVHFTAEMRLGWISLPRQVLKWPGWKVPCPSVRCPVAVQSINSFVLQQSALEMFFRTWFFIC